MTTLSLSLTHTITAFIESLVQNGKAACTVASYQHDLQLLARLLGTSRRPVALTALTREHLEAAMHDPQWTLGAQGQPLSAASLNKRLAAVRSFFRWADQVGLLEANPTSTFTAKKIHRPLPSVITSSEVERVRAAVAGEAGWLARRDQVLLECFLSVGLQLHEVFALTIDDLALEANRLQVGTTAKYLNRECRAALATYLPWRIAQTGVTTRALFLSQRGTPLSARSVASRVAYWLAAAGLPAGLSPKSLRYTFAVRLYQARPNLRLVQQALGHKDLRTTAIYTVLMDGELETVMEGL